ncbi:MAG: hypothetical protein ABI837_08240 [Acidobacteriota bacterium]
MRRWNWSLWLGLMLSVAAFATYFAIFARYPVTRDIPWASFLLFAIALALLVAGVRRASRKIIPVIVAFIGAGILVFFTTIILVGSKDLPLSHGASRDRPEGARFHASGHESKTGCSLRPSRRAGREGGRAHLLSRLLVTLLQLRVTGY